ncbi:unnamed protein product [Miscanthus lutarioriparius]|uniref:Uncharacterized protein n=1 Tax=Miscanthus lutarioriparius TaxID=422564 RepID=A0A811S354_9POAL|nr:unnamed protein product [Miscanthus lutarioriparius]
MITKETVADSFIDILRKRRPFKKYPPMTDRYSNLLSKYDPKLCELSLMDRARRNCRVDLHADVLRQYTEKGFAEAGVDFTDGVKKIFVLPQPQQQVI